MTRTGCGSWCPTSPPRRLPVRAAGSGRAVACGRCARPGAAPADPPRHVRAVGGASPCVAPFLAITGLAAGTTALVVLKAAPGASAGRPDLPTAPAGQPRRAGHRPRRRADAAGTDPAGGPPTSRPSAEPRRDQAAARPPPAGGTEHDERTPTLRGPPPSAAASRPPGGRSPATARADTEYGVRPGADHRLRQPDRRRPSRCELPERASRGPTQHSDDVSQPLRRQRREAVQEQSADLDTVSGATDTSDSYKESLQSAIEQGMI